MKKTQRKNNSNTLFMLAFKGFLIFTLFSMALYAYAVVYPDPGPGPVSGVVGMYVGRTTGIYDGDDVGNYHDANDLCDVAGTVMEDSHVCSPMEMVNTYNHNVDAVNGESGVVWVNAGTPSNLFPSVSDCRGWSSVTDGSGIPYFANSWNFAVDAPGIQQCNSTRAYACCK